MERINVNHQIESISVKRLYSEDWKAYRKIRLEALKTDPEGYRSDFAVEAKRNNEFWISMLGNKNTAVFGLFYGVELIGSARVTLDATQTDYANLGASYIQKEHRGGGLSKLLFSARVLWAKEMKCSQLFVAHLEGNFASEGAIKKAGFSHYSTQLIYDIRQGRKNMITYIMQI